MGADMSYYKDMEDNTIILDSLDNLPKVEEKTAVVLPDGRSGFLYPKGDIRNSSGSYMVRPPYGNESWTRDTARQAVKKREELRSEAIQHAIIAGTGAKDLAGGVERLGREIVKVVLNGQGRDKVVAFKELMRHGAMAGDLGRGGAVGGQGSGGSGGLSPEAWGALNRLLPILRDRLDSE